MEELIIRLGAQYFMNCQKNGIFRVQASVRVVHALEMLDLAPNQDVP